MINNSNCVRQERTELHKVPAGDAFALQPLIKCIFIFHLNLLNAIKNNSNTAHGIQERFCIKGFNQPI